MWSPPRSRADALGASPAPPADGWGVAPGGTPRDYSPTAGAASPDPRYARLPARAAAKLRKLAGDSSDADLAAYQLAQRRQGFVEAKRIAQINIDNLQYYRGPKIALNPREPPGVHEHERALASAQADLAAALGELADIDQRIERLNSRKSALVPYVFTWLRDRVPPGGDILEEHPSPAPVKLAKGETWITAVAALRAKIAALKADAAEVASTPLSSALVKQRARAQIEALAERGRPIVLPALEIGREIIFRSTTARVDVASAAGAAMGTAAVEDAVALLAFIARDQLVAAIEQEIDELADDAHALAPDEARNRGRDLEARVLETERLEEAAIEAAAAADIEIARRVDMDPRAFLGLASSLPAPRNA
jgi:hypothetical protein